MSSSMDPKRMKNDEKWRFDYRQRNLAVVFCMVEVVGGGGGCMCGEYRFVESLRDAMNQLCG